MVSEVHTVNNAGLRGVRLASKQGQAYQRALLAQVLEQQQRLVAHAPPLIPLLETLVQDTLRGQDTPERCQMSWVKHEPIEGTTHEPVLGTPHSP